MENLSLSQTWKMETGNFIHDIIEEDISKGLVKGPITTRFPPEPNGYLHIGHAKSITLNFGTAAKFGGYCNLRFDDTNPAKEEDEYVQSIIEDVKWLTGHDQFSILYASDYFQSMHDFAVQMIQLGKAYVDSCSPEEINRMRGAPTTPGQESPYRNRTVEENLDLFAKMAQGKLEEGSCVLRAKIDMTSPNIWLRDPIMYRIKKVPHHRAGSQWNIYPMYDWAHGWEDSLEKITHSLCTLEFENHRPLYDWFLSQIPGAHRPKQIEFNKLNISYTMLSKRRLIELVKEGRVESWDDPRMPTLCGLRRRGYTASALRKFCESTGYTKTDGQVDLAMLEFFIREELNKEALRVMAVLNPIKVIITNYPEGQNEETFVENNPEKPELGSRSITFGREIWIDEEDFAENPPKGYFRLFPGGEVRLKGAYFLTCQEVVKDSEGRIAALHCTYDPLSKGGESPDGRKVKGTIQWVSAQHGVPLEARFYEPLLSIESYGDIPEGEDYRNHLNPGSLKVYRGYGEPALAQATAGVSYQFIRKGYFVADVKGSRPGAPVFNRTVGLKDAWAKIVKKT